MEDRVINAPAVSITNTSFELNIASFMGGTIYTVPYQYESPITDENSDKNLTTDNQTIFSGNTAGAGLFAPPSDYQYFTNLAFDTASDVNHGILTRKSLLTNYDVNYKRPGVEIIFDANGGAFADGTNMQSGQYEQGEEITIIDAPTREGYTYKITEVPNPNLPYHFASTVYTFTDHVYEQDDQLVSERTFLRDGQPINSITAYFTNEYTGPNSLQEQVQQLPATGAADSLGLSIGLLTAGALVFALRKKW